ncbi:MAG: hypothetical protein Q8Q06_02065 [bacterium]|nr:hypothetical protein [bacterium]
MYIPKITKLDKIENQNNLSEKADSDLIKKIKMIEDDIANLERLKTEKFIDEVPSSGEIKDYSKGMQEMIEHQIKSRREDLDKLKREIDEEENNDEDIKKEKFKIVA